MSKTQLTQFTKSLQDLNSHLIKADSLIHQLHCGLFNQLHYTSSLITSKRMQLMDTWEQLMASLQEAPEETENPSNSP